MIGFAVAVSASAGATFGVLWERGNKAARVEDAVASEIRLLDQHRLTPTCDQVQKSTKGTGEAKSSGATVHWRLLPGDGQLARVVVGADLTVAYETTDSPCHRPP